MDVIKVGKWIKINRANTIIEERVGVKEVDISIY